MLKAGQKNKLPMSRFKREARLKHAYHRPKKFRVYDMLPTKRYERGCKRRLV